MNYLEERFRIDQRATRPRKSFLYVRAEKKTLGAPVIDSLTRKITAAWRRSRSSELYFMGFHVCTCGARSDSTDHLIGEDFVTNSLCIHYVALHRDECSKEDLEIVRNLPYGEEEPTEEELHVKPKWVNTTSGDDWRLKTK